MENPQTKVWQERHGALDLAAPTGTNVHAFARGTVVDVRTTAQSRGYGDMILVKHKGGYYSLYAHLSKVDVEKGQEIGNGVIIGEVGSTGYSTGPHLHLEVIKYNGDNMWDIYGDSDKKLRIDPEKIGDLDAFLRGTADSGDPASSSKVTLSAISEVSLDISHFENRIENIDFRLRNIDRRLKKGKIDKATFDSKKQTLEARKGRIIKKRECFKNCVIFFLYININFVRIQDG